MRPYTRIMLMYRFWWFSKSNTVPAAIMDLKITKSVHQHSHCPHVFVQFRSDVSCGFRVLIKNMSKMTIFVILKIQDGHQDLKWPPTGPEMVISDTFRIKTLNPLLASERNGTQTCGHTQGLCWCTDLVIFKIQHGPDSHLGFWKKKIRKFKKIYIVFTSS